MHPLLAALTMSLPIISMEDWVLPSGTVPAVTDEAGYRQRLAQALAEDTGSGVFYTWGFHHYFHGSLSRALLDEMSPTRPVVVWHRSAHEMYLNSAALEHFAITPEFLASLPEAAREQSDYEQGHFWEQGWFPILPKIAPDLASPERVHAGLEFTESYLHAAGVTVACGHR